MRLALYRMREERSMVRNHKGAAMPAFAVTSAIDKGAFEVTSQ